MKITIPGKIYDQIQFFVDKSTIECSGLGKVIVTPQGYEVTEVTLLEQENTATHTEINPAAVTKAMYNLRNSPGGVYFWWHSHVNMGVFWSGTDVATIEEIGANGLCVAVVFNKKREKRGAVWLKGHDLSPSLYFDDIPVVIDYNTASVETMAAWAKEFDEKCKARTVIVPEYRSGVFDYGGIAPEQGHFPLRGLGADSFDLLKFEKDLVPADYIEMQSESNSLMYAVTVNQANEALAKILQIVKRSKATKHEKKKAYWEYKEMCIDQKNYIAEKEALWEEAEARHNVAN